MTDGSSAPVSIRLPELGPEWKEAANLAIHNLGFQPPLAVLCPEHWQRVLVSVSNRMLMRGSEMPPGWQPALAKQVGRRDGTIPTENSVVPLRVRRETTDEAPQS
jgi:hypothetical protein